MAETAEPKVFLKALPRAKAEPKETQEPKENQKADTAENQKADTAAILEHIQQRMLEFWVFEENLASIRLLQPSKLPLQTTHMLKRSAHKLAHKLVHLLANLLAHAPNHNSRHFADARARVGRNLAVLAQEYILRDEQEPTHPRVFRRQSALRPNQ